MIILQLEKSLCSAGYVVYDVISFGPNLIKFRETPLSDCICAIDGKDGIVIYDHKGLQVDFIRNNDSLPVAM